MNLDQHLVSRWFMETSGRFSSWRQQRMMLQALLLLFSFPVLFVSCKKAPPPPTPPPIVEVMNVVGTNAPLETEIIGQLDSPTNVEVRARIEAFVDKVLFTEGTEIKAGDQLFLLDKKPFEERLAAANGALGEAKAALNKSQKDVARLQPLAARRAVPQQDLDNANASVDVGQASVLSAQARVESAKIDLGYCDVRAPISGLIGAKQVSIGELVGRGQPTLLATISALDPMWVYCTVSEVQYLKAKHDIEEKGKDIFKLPLSLILADGSVHPYKGHFVFIDRAVDVKTGTIRIRAEFPNPKRLLRPGMFARIKVEIGEQPGSVLIPERAVVELQGKNFVWMIGHDNKASQRAIKVGDSIGGSLLVLEGLKPGDRIVVEGVQKLRQGAQAQPMTAEQIAQTLPSTNAPQKSKEGEDKHSEE